MSTADLRRLIQQATPRVEDVRSPDRTDIIRREHKHLSLRQAVDALDALEFTADSFTDRMQDILGADGAGAASAETALHGLLRVVAGLRVLSPAVPAPEPPAPPEAEPQSEVGAGLGWKEAAATAKARGAELFRQKDFPAAAAEYAAAIRTTPSGQGDVHTLHSNRSAALLQAGDAATALAAARRAVELAPEWPKGHFREGCCLRQLGRLPEALRAFRRGGELEPENGDWEKEVEKTEKLHRGQPAALVRQALLYLLPDLLAAWARGGDAGGVLQVQVNGELADLGTPKWSLLREGKAASKAQLRYAFSGKKGYLANLAANLQTPAEGVAVVDLEGKPLQIPQIVAFLWPAASGKTAPEVALVHLDIKNGAGGMAAVLCLLPRAELQRFLAPAKDPAPPRGAVEGVLQIQQRSGFPKALPRLLGFQSFPGDLNFPVIDLQRDAPDAAKSD